MRRILLITGTALAALVASGVVAPAGNAPAQIVNCSTATACYSPDPIHVTTGATISWSNGTSLAHTAPAESAAGDTGAIATGATSSAITFNTPGTFAYHCRFHSDMHGSIIVTAAVTATPAATAAPTVRPSAGRTVRALAQSGNGPAPALGALTVLLGLLVLSGGWLRRQGSKGHTKAIDEPR
jgi:plastocyanin